MRRALPALGALAAAFVAFPARAAVPLDLTWNAPAECPSAQAVRGEFQRLARLPPGGRTPSRLAAVGDVDARGGRWHLRLRTLRDGVAGERELEADSCAALARAAPLVMALALGFDVQAAEPPSAPEPPRPRPPRPRVVEAPPPAAPPPPEPPPPPPPPPAPVEVITVAPPPPAPVPTRWSLAVEGRGTVRGPLRGAGLGASLGLDVARGHWLASVRADGWWPSDEPTVGRTVPDDAIVRERVTAFGGTASLCGTTGGERRVVFAACLGARAAAVRASLSDAPLDTPGVAPWIAAVPAVRARVHLFGALHLDAGLELAASIVRPNFIATNLSDVTVPALVPAAVLGIAADL